MLKLLKYEILQSLCYKKDIWQIILFFIITMFLNLYFHNNYNDLYIIISIWITIILTSIIGIDKIWQGDIKNGIILQLYLSGITRTEIITVKMLSKLLTIWLPIILIILCAMNIYGYNMILILASNIIILSLFFTIIDVCFSLITSAYKSNILLSTIIIIPFKIPVMILTLYSILYGQNNIFLVLLIGILFVILPIMIIMSNYLLRVNLEI